MNTRKPANGKRLTRFIAFVTTVAVALALAPTTGDAFIIEETAGKLPKKEAFERPVTLAVTKGPFERSATLAVAKQPLKRPATPAVAKEPLKPAAAPATREEARMRISKQNKALTTSMPNPIPIPNRKAMVEFNFAEGVGHYKLIEIPFAERKGGDG